MSNSYQENGYFLAKAFFSWNELQEIHRIITTFHASWKKKNPQFYKSKAVNSAYLTGTEYLDDMDRGKLFRFIAASKLMDLVGSTVTDRPAFMNTQLFFNPVQVKQKNYWHRDPQYHMSVEEQKEALKGPDVFHVRIPLAAEPGLELVPSSHKHWDSDEELEVRLGRNGRNVYDALPAGKRIPLSVGDVLIFSANMIHRGLYGLERLAFDIVFFEPDSNIAQFADDSCLPTPAIMNKLENAEVFKRTIGLKESNAKKTPRR